MLLRLLTTGMCVAATGAWYRLRAARAEGAGMLKGAFARAVLIPAQIFLGHLNGDYVHQLSARQVRRDRGPLGDEQPASEVLIALPDPFTARTTSRLKVPELGSFVGGIGPATRGGPPDFRVATGHRWLSPSSPSGSWSGGTIMMAVAWIGTVLMLIDRLERSRLILGRSS